MIFEKGDILEFTGHKYNIAKIYNYEELFKEKKLVVENILKCPCEKRK